MPRWTPEMQSSELAALRAECGKTRNDAAHEFGVSLETLRRYENGGVSLPMEIAEAMTKYYGASFESIREAARIVREEWLSTHAK